MAAAAAASSAAPAAASGPGSCTGDTCTATFAYTGSEETFTVPDGVTTLSFGVRGAQGATSNAFRIPGGEGGAVTGSLPVVAGETLTLLVGQAGNTGGGAGAYGGGGQNLSGEYFGSGGGGSFVFDANGDVLLAAGGGGASASDGGPCGQRFQGTGGAGAGAGSVGGAGVGGCYSGEQVATGGGPSGPGTAGSGRYGTGLPGSGPAGAFAPGIGGNGGGQSPFDYYAGAGGGGGYYGGGGGGYIQSGAGGSGYATAVVTDLDSMSGVNPGDGQIVFSWPSQITAQALAFTGSVPSTATVGDSYTVTASGGASGNPVTFSADAATTNSACSVSVATVSFDHAGTCLLDADQAGDADYSAAPTAQWQIVVSAIVPAAVLRTSVLSPEFGQTVTASVHVPGTPSGLVQFTVDGLDLGAPIVTGTLLPDPSIVLTSSGHDLTLGTHQIGSVFAPSDTTRYATAVTGPQALVVSPARTSTSVTVLPASLTAVVSRLSAGTAPTGSVTFFVDGTAVGTAPVSGTVARLAYRVPPRKVREVAAVFAGDSGFVNSSVSTARHDPSITARVRSRNGRSRYGWYDGPVTVSFTCTTDGAALVTACPKAVTLTRTGAAQAVTRTIGATNGGVATVAVTGIDIDRGRPSVHVAGVTPGGTYFAAAPGGRCAGRDSASRVATCVISRRSHGGRIDYTVTATDLAGNTATARVSAFWTNETIAGKVRRNGIYTVRVGHSYTLLAVAGSRPQYIDAALYPRRPVGRDTRFTRVGPHLWSLKIRIDAIMGGTRLWNLGVRIGGVTQVLTVRVTP